MVEGILVIKVPFSRRAFEIRKLRIRCEWRERRDQE